MNRGMGVENAERRRQRVPAWLVLGLTGLVTMLLAQWARPGVDVVLVAAGGVMMVSAVFWARFWVSQFLPRTGRLIPITRQFSHRHLDDRDGTDMGRQTTLGSSQFE